MPEPDEIDTYQSGEPPLSSEPPLEDESNPAAQPVEVESGDTESDPATPEAQAVSLPDESQPGQVELQVVAQAVSLPEDSQPGQVEQQGVAQAVSLPGESQPGQFEQQVVAQAVSLPDESQPGQVEQQGVAQAVSLPEESQPGQVELQVEQPEPRRLSRGERETVDRVRQRFVACGRCGSFIVDCQNQLGVEAVQTALLDTADGWVNLTADHSFHRRVMDAYGVELDAEFDSFDGTCPECRRRFVVKNDTDGLTYLKIRV